MVTMLTYLAGMNYRPGARERVNSLLPGEQFKLCHEPTNLYDKNAVAVYDGSLHVGYVPKADAPAVVKALAELGPERVRCTYKGHPSSTTIQITWGD